MNRAHSRSGSAGAAAGGREAARGCRFGLCVAALLALLVPDARAEASRLDGGAAASRLPVAAGRDTVPEDTLTPRGDLRKKAGLRAGRWSVVGLESEADASYTTIPALEAYLQEGLGDHLAVEYGVGLWQRSRATLGGRTEAWVAPLFTGLKAYPLTGPASRLQPYLSLGGGVALGLEARRSSGYGNVSTGSRLAAGVGVKAGGGVEVELGRGFGLVLEGRYQVVQYAGAGLAGQDTFHGSVLGAGLTVDLRGLGL